MLLIAFCFRKIVARMQDGLSPCEDDDGSWNGGGDRSRVVTSFSRIYDVGITPVVPHS